MNRIVMRVKNGVVKTLYTEAINLKAFGSKLLVERASNVEYDNVRGGWTVEFMPNEEWATGSVLSSVRRSDGSVHHWWASLMKSNAHVFATREAALAAEVEFLQNKLAGGVA